MKLIIKTGHNYLRKKKANASLTVEASLVLPIFMFFFISFLYFIQIFILQEELQKAMTETGFTMARATYLYSDFVDVEDMDFIDSSLLEDGIHIGLQEMAGAVINNIALKKSVESRINKGVVNYSCIVGGLDGIGYDGSKVLQGDQNIDIVIRYRVRIPIRIFGIQEMDMIQRVKLRGWSGHQVPALYTIREESGEEERIVYITESGTVYHTSNSCPHIRLSIEAVIGKPANRRNKSGGKYYACESCCSNQDSGLGTYYITSYGTRYHTDRSCSKIKRTVMEIPLSKVGVRARCKRCGG